jgi:RNA polymerase sigma-70 factor, ECF subfamily
MEDFESYRPLLFSIAYRMTGSASDADDIVQETYLRYRAAPAAEIHSLKSYLSTIVTHLCIDYLKSAHAQREQYIGSWLPEPVLTADTDIMPLERVEQRESISLAFLVLLESLTPPERAVFLLHEVFAYSFQEIAEIIGKSAANCRQLFHRARQRVAERKPRFEPSPEIQQQLITRFLVACQSGNLPALTEMLAHDAISWSDGGGKVVAALQPIYGRERVIRFWLGLARKAPADFSVTVEEVNGSLAILAWFGQSLSFVCTFNSRDGQIQGIRAVSNPDKLLYIQRQLQTRRNAFSGFAT